MEAWQAESSSSAKSETRNGRSRGRRAVYVLTVETCSGSCTSTLSDKPTPSSSCLDYPQGTRRVRVQSMLNRLLVLATPPTFNRAMQSWNSRAQVFNLNKRAMEGGRAAVPIRISSSSLPIVIPSSSSSSTTVPAGKQFSSLALCLPIVVVSDVRHRRRILRVDSTVSLEPEDPMQFKRGLRWGCFPRGISRHPQELEFQGDFKNSKCSAALHAHSWTGGIQFLPEILRSASCKRTGKLQARSEISVDDAPLLLGRFEGLRAGGELKEVEIGGRMG